MRKEIKDAIAEFDKKVPHKTSGSPTCIVSTTGVRIPLNIGCYGGIRSGVGDTGGDIIGLITRIQDPAYTSNDKAVIKHYLNYLVHQSVFSRAFVSKDVDEIYSSQYIEMDVTVPANLMLDGMFATRHLWENPHHVKLFFDLSTSTKYNRDLLLLVVNGCSNMKQNNQMYFSPYGGGLHGHRTFDSHGFSVAGLHRLCCGELLKVAPCYADQPEYVSVHTMFDSLTARSNTYNQICKDKYVKYRPQEAKDNNIFISAKKTIKASFDYKNDYELYEDFIQSMKNFLPHLIDAIGEYRNGKTQSVLSKAG